ncbi:MAG: hypothetical protein QOF76_4419, partial [Solirubrobacteraceae bacterium]|nr:hypothetical protein [Solirubrobacteraceae bacterium]
MKRTAQHSPEKLVATTLPALLIVGLSLKSGGYPPGIPATAACLILLLLAALVLLAPGAVRPLGGPQAIVALALVGLTAWTLASTLWSHAPARAVTAASRDLFYLVTFCGLATLRAPALRSVVRGCAAGAVIVTVIALGPRLAPDVFSLSPDATTQRLAWPLSYQNALGLLLSLGLLLTLHLTSDRGERLGVQMAAAAAVPPIVSALWLT